VLGPRLVQLQRLGRIRRGAILQHGNKKATELGADRSRNEAKIDGRARRYIFSPDFER